MPQTPQDLSIDFKGYTPLKLGDLVEFKAKSFENGFTEIKVTTGKQTRVIKNGQTKMIPPTMTVTEIVVENDGKSASFDEKSGASLEVPVKVNCLWFSNVTCAFQTRWFNIGLLKRVELINSIPDTPLQFEYHQVVTLITTLKGNRKWENIFNHELVGEKESGSYQITKVFDTTLFAPPKMVVIDMGLTDKIAPLYSKKTGKRIRYATNEYVKCMWYDPTKDKYSEHTFIPQVLIPESLAEKYSQEYSPFSNFEEE